MRAWLPGGQRKAPSLLTAEARPWCVPPRLRIDRHAGVRSLVALALASLFAAIVPATDAGAGAIRGNLYGVVDFSAYGGGPATERGR